MADRLVRLTTFFSTVEARVLASKLDAYGIYALAPAEFVSVSPHLMTTHGGIPIYVLARDLETARLLVEPDGETPPSPRRRGLETLAALVILAQGVPPAPAPAFARSQLWFTGPLSLALVAAGLLAFLPDAFVALLVFGSSLE